MDCIQRKNKPGQDYGEFKILIEVNQPTKELGSPFNMVIYGSKRKD
jgi:hypothetical protein